MQSQEPLAVSIDEASRLLSISKSGMKTLIANGTIASFSVGRRRLIAKDAIATFIATRQAAANV